MWGRKYYRSCLRTENYRIINAFFFYFYTILRRFTGIKGYFCDFHQFLLAFFFVLFEKRSSTKKDSIFTLLIFFFAQNFCVTFLPFSREFFGSLPFLYLMIGLFSLDFLINQKYYPLLPVTTLQNIFCFFTVCVHLEKVVSRTTRKKVYY